ncbi:ABC transporter permease [Aureimonas populi]|uniref:ABC transporter permease n=1 Tax=Aureimonas populi TaxID=1701758 RepID=A0ABW5CQM0_9HYPH|nr:iron ABC transporter permease [Aureimonas populi]
MADIGISLGRAPLPGARRLPRPRGEALLLLGLALYVGLFSAFPLLRLLSEALGANAEGEFLGTLRESWSSRAVRRAFWNTLGASGAAVAVSALLGTALAFCVTLAPVRARVAATFLILSPLLIPSQITALAWIELFGSSSPLLAPLGLAPTPGTPNPLYSGTGIALLMGIEHMPFVFLAVRASLLAVPQDLIEAARIAGVRTGRVVSHILLPLALPAVLAGSILAFAAALGNFGVPALLGIPGRFPMLTTLIYQRLAGFGPSVMGQVASLSMILLAMAAAALCARGVLVRRLSVPIAGGQPLRPLLRGRAAVAAGLFVWGAILLTAVAPLLALVGASLVPAVGVRLSPETATLANYAATIGASGTVRRAFANSFQLSLGAAAAAVLIAIPLAYLCALRRSGPARLVQSIADMPFVVPGTVFALAMILVFLAPLPLLGVSIYGTATILFLAYAARFLPLVLRPTTSALEAVEPALDEAGRMLGARLFRRLAFIVAPVVAPAAVAGGLLVFMTAFNELTVSALLWSSGVETVGVMIFSLQYEGNSTGAAAISTLSVLFVLLLALLLDRLGRRLPPGTLPWRS